MLQQKNCNKINIVTLQQYLMSSFNNYLIVTLTKTACLCKPFYLFVKLGISIISWQICASDKTAQYIQWRQSFCTSWTLTADLWLSEYHFGIQSNKIHCLKQGSNLLLFVVLFRATVAVPLNRWPVIVCSSICVIRCLKRWTWVIFLIGLVGV